ncbi:hypothetical protein REPUB_Repub10bG0134600 [Reevesia pubescens]
MLAQERFKAESSDIIVCSTWIKALTFALSLDTISTSQQILCSLRARINVCRPSSQAKAPENEPISMEEALELFCEGKSLFGPW